MKLNLRAYLANIQMTMKEFSQLLECSPDYLRLIASGKKFPSKRLAKDIHQLTDGIVVLPQKPPKASKKNNTNKAE